MARRTIPKEGLQERSAREDEVEVIMPVDVIDKRTRNGIRYGAQVDRYAATKL